MNPARPTPSRRSLADYLVRYDFATILEEAREDYSQSSSGAPRLLDQKDIAARFRKAKPAAPTTTPKPDHG